MAEANLRWRAQTSEAEAQILALKAVIDSIHSTSTRQGIRSTSREIEKIGKDGEKAASLVRRGFDALDHQFSRFGATVIPAMGSAFAGLATVAQGALIPALVAIAVTLGTIAALAAPVLAAMAAVAGLGAYFDIIKKGTPLHKQFFATLRDIFNVVGKIAGVVAKPLFRYLLAQLRDLDGWVRTAEFSKGMHEIGRMLPRVAKAVIGAGKSMVRWYIEHWPEIKTVLLTTLAVFGKIADGVKWLAKQWHRHGNQIKQAAQEMAAAIRPQLQAIIKIITAVGAAIKWLSDHTPGWLKSFASDINKYIAPAIIPFQHLLDIVNSAISAVQTLAGLNPFSSGHIPAGASPGGHTGTFRGGRASGGPVGPGTWLVGEEGPEMLTMGHGSGYVTPNHRLGGGRSSHSRRGAPHGYVEIKVWADQRSLARAVANGSARLA